MTNYTPKIDYTNRNEKIALWVNMPTNITQNIWDLDKSKLNVDVISAINSAFILGMHAYKMLIKSVDVDISSIIKESEKLHRSINK